MLPALLIDFDKNSEALHQQFPPGQLFMEPIEDFRMKGSKRVPNGYEQAKKVITDLHEGKLDFKPKTLIIDSVTRLYEAIMDHGLNASSRGEEAPPQLQDYGIASRLMVLFLRVCIQTNCNIIFLAHEKAYANEVTGIEKGVPALTGQLGDIVPRYFQEILHAKAKGAGDKREWKWDTGPMGKFVGRTTRGLDTTVEQDWSIYK
tara:strand:+ start:52 stop:663 length:612 start_codon:yes stop_codon:yes gene_type:complete